MEEQKGNNDSATPNSPVRNAFSMSPSYVNASGVVGPGTAADPRNQLFGTSQVISLNRKPPETLALDAKGKLSTTMIHKWMENMQSILAVDHHLSVTQHITVDAKLYLGLRFRQFSKPDDPAKNGDWETKWNSDQLFKALHYIWPKGVDNVT